MLSDVFEKFSVECFSAVRSKQLKPGNERLFKALPDKDLSVIFYLMPYYVKDTAPRLSKYGAVYDYHGFAENVSNALKSYFTEKYPYRFCEAYADHSPYAEVNGAAAAGLGVIGENSLLINDKYASFVFIGEIVCDLNESEIQSEGITFGNGETKHCSRCGTCKKSCPVNCEDFTLCTSHITQKKGELTESEKRVILNGGYIWGCDTCQISCPVCQRQIKSGKIQTPIEYFTSGAIRENAAETIRSMTDEEYKKYPFSWRKKEVILRNIEIIENGTKNEKN